MLRPGDRALLDAAGYQTWVHVHQILDDECASVTFDATDGGWMIVPIAALKTGQRQTGFVKPKAELRRESDTVSISLQETLEVNK
jgi:hypothetical protein